MSGPRMIYPCPYCDEDFILDVRTSNGWPWYSLAIMGAAFYYTVANCQNLWNHIESDHMDLVEEFRETYRFPPLAEGRL